MRQSLPLLLLFVACVSDSNQFDAGPTQGEENGPCFSNGTCNTGLICVVPNKCVRPDAGAQESSVQDVVSELAVDAPVVDAGKCPTTGLLAWWKGENNGADEQEFVPMVPLAGASYTTPAQVGYAFSLSGTSYLDGNKHVDNLTALTIEAWIQPTSVNGTILSQRSDAGSGFELRLEGGMVTFSGSSTLKSTSTLAASIKHHVAATFNGSSATVYLDGQPNGGPMPFGLANDTVNLRIGSGYGPANVTKNLYVGWIDELAIYSKALSDTQIDAIAKGDTTKCK